VPAVPQGTAIHRKAPCGINDEDSSTVKGFVKKNGYEMPVLMDGQRQVHRQYGVSAIPTLLIIDRQGVIRQHLENPNAAK
jgi:cytochrome c biogenesis protein CcmG/thiol:disulfide interchange protein DsbE